MTDVEPLSKPGPPGMKQGGPGAMGNDGIPRRVKHPNLV